MKLKLKITGLLIMLSLFGCSSNYKGPVSENFNGKHFFHKWGNDDKSFFKLLKWQITSEKKAWPDFKNVPVEKIPDLKRSLTEVSVTFVNHATVYIQAYGLRFITDPHWSQRASPVSFAGPRRIFNAGVDIEQLPGLDFVMVSHNHYDHLDLATLKKLSELYNPTFYVPLGDSYLLKDIQITKFIELDWWKPVLMENGLELTFVPVKHWSARGLTDRNKSLWGGYVLENKTAVKNFKIFFAGDTGYCTTFSELNKKYGDFDLSLLPIGAYEPRWFMKDGHMNPAEAVQAHLDLKSKYSLGIHWGLWQLTDEGISDPITDLKKALDEKSITSDFFQTYELGQTKILKN